MTDTAAEYDRHVERSGGRPLFGALLLAAGAVWLVNQTHIIHLSAEALLSVLLIAIGFSLVATGRRQRGPGMVIMGGIVAALVVMNPSNAHNWIPHGSAPDFVRPASLNELQSSYDKGVGDLNIDLTSVTLAAGTTSLEARVGAGNLTVVVPQGVPVTVDVNDGVGNVNLEGDQLGGGIGTHQEWTSPGYGQASVRLDLHLRVGAGNITVETAPAAPALTPKTVPTVPPVPTAPTTVATGQGGGQ